jgi:hypothetical protein
MKLAPERRKVCCEACGDPGLESYRLVPDRTKTLVQRILEQTAPSIRDFSGDSIGRLKGWVQGDRSHREDLAEQLSRGEARARS